MKTITRKDDLKIGLFGNMQEVQIMGHSSVMKKKP